MEQAAADRLYTELHEKRPFHDGTFRNFAERSSPAFPYHFQDGVTIFVAPEDLAPDDGFLTTHVAESNTEDPGDRANGPGA